MAVAGAGVAGTGELDATTDFCSATEVSAESSWMTVPKGVSLGASEVGVGDGFAESPTEAVMLAATEAAEAGEAFPAESS